MIEAFNDLAPYSLNKHDKENLLFPHIRELTRFHADSCPLYRNYLEALGFDYNNLKTLEDIPFLPIRAFKELDLKSVSDGNVFKIMMSSGTSGQKQSRIYLDKKTAILQQRVLLKLLADFVGSVRKPMLVIDSQSIVSNRKRFTTRGATIMGLDFFTTKMVFALNDDMTLNIEKLCEFINRYREDDFIIFGFTYMVWKHFFDELDKHHIVLDLSKGSLLTAGGWKKSCAVHL